MAVIAVTGDIGAGKSTVAKLLAGNLHCPRFDADVIVLKLWQRDAIKSAAVSRLGLDILDPSGNIIKKRIAERIFTDLADYKWCCKLIHPLVTAELETLVKGTKNCKHAVVEIPLLFEAGRPAWVDHVVFVTAPFEVRAKRCEDQRGWTENELLRREKFLIPSSERIRLSNTILNNVTDLSDLEKQVSRISDLDLLKLKPQTS